MYVDSKHPYYQQFRDAQLNLDIAIVDEHMQPIIQLLRDHTDIITLHCCEGHLDGAQQAYLMMTGPKETLEFLTRWITELPVRYNDIDEPIQEYTLEVAMAFNGDDNPPYLAYTIRTALFDEEEYKLLLLKQLTDTLCTMLNVNLPLN